MKIIERATFVAEGQRMLAALQQLRGRWSVRVRVTEGDKVITSGYVGVGPEAEIRKLWAWTLQQAEAKRWVRAPHGSRRLVILPGIPEPGARGTAAPHPPDLSPAANRGPGRPRKADGSVRAGRS